MKSSHNKLLGLLVLLLFVVPLGTTIKKVYRELRQPKLNSALIVAIKKNDTAAVVALLREGADSNARDLPPDTRSLWKPRAILAAILVVGVVTTGLLVMKAQDRKTNSTGDTWIEKKRR